MTTIRQKHLDSLTRAEAAERAADQRKEQIRANVETDLALRWRAQKKFWDSRSFEIEVDITTDRLASKDPTWTSHAGKNQWFIQKAIMYGTAVNSELLESLLTLHRRG